MGKRREVPGTDWLDGWQVGRLSDKREDGVAGQESALHRLGGVIYRASRSSRLLNSLSADSSGARSSEAE